MTEKTIVECDAHRCDEHTEHSTNGAVPPDWGLLVDGEGADRHLCPTHAFRAKRWVCAGSSDGDALEVKHNYVDTDAVPDEVYAHGDTLSFSLMPVVDETDKFPEYDPPLGHDEQPTEAYGVHVFDHLHVYVIGAHKNEPHVVVDSDEFPTVLEVWDTENSFERVDLGAGVSGVNRA